MKTPDPVEDIMGEEITHLNIENENSSSLIFFNSGGALTDINLKGGGNPKNVNVLLFNKFFKQIKYFF